MGIEAVLVLLLLVTPGLVADGAYRFVLWRPAPDDSIRFTRALVLSVAGLLLYLLLVQAGIPLLPPPRYLSREWWATSWSGDLQSAVDVAVPWALHSVSSLVVAGLAVLLMKRKWVASLVRFIAGQSLHRSAWQEFAAANHEKWVFVRLKDGRHYYAQLGVVSGDHSGSIVLWHPYPYDEESATYEVTGTHALYLPSDSVASVLVAAAPEELKKLEPRLGVYRLTTGEKVHDSGEQGPAGEQQHDSLGA